MVRKHGALSLSLAFVFALFASLFGAGVQSAQAVSSTVVISQFQVAGATAADEFVELHNVGNASFDLNGHRLVYRSAAGTTDVALVNWTTSTVIPAGGYYLITIAAGYDDAITADATWGGGSTGSFAGTSGGLALRNGAANTGIIIDSVGYGTATNGFVEGTATTAPAANASRIRTGNACTDSDNNSSDFTGANPSTPRNLASPAQLCGTTPPPSTAPNITTQPQSQTITNGQTATLSVVATGTDPLSYQWYQGTSGNTSTPVGANAASYTTPALSEATSYWVRVSNSAGVTDSNTVTITVETAPTSCPNPTHLISAIQGSGSSAAVTGSVTVQGVVTGIFPGLNTINVQEEASDSDGNAVTSEGIAVFMGSSFSTFTAGLQVDEVVSISGTAGDRVTSGVSQTQLSGTITLAECGLIEQVAPVDVRFPLMSVSDLEVYESMLVRFPQNLFIAEYFNYDRFGEIVLGLPLDGTDRFYNPTSVTTPGAAANELSAQYALRRITLDDAISSSSPSSLTHPNGEPFSATNSFRGGDTVAGTTGVIEHSFGVYRLQPTTYGTYTAKNPRQNVPESVGGTLKVASYNVLNYFLSIDTTSSSSLGSCGPAKDMDCRGADSQFEFNRQRSKLLEALETINADVYGLIELENTTGVEPMADIVDGLNATFGAGTFAYINTGTIGTDAIKVGIIYKPGKVTPVGAYQTLDEGDDARFDTNRNRPALAQTFEEKATGARFTLVVNHLKSKGSGCGTSDPDKNDGQGNCNLTRKAAAEALVDWLAKDPTGSNDSDFLIVGDLNAYAKEDPITAIKVGADDVANTADDYINLIEDRLGTYAYSYVFGGQAGYLDHALANKTLNSQVTGITDWHLNSDEPDIFDYNDTVQDAGESSTERKGIDVTDAQSPFRTSDHDPVIVGLNLKAPNRAPVANEQSVTTTEDTATAITLSGSDADGDALTYTIVDGPANGTLSGTGANRTYTPNANFNGTDSFTFKVNDGTTGSNVATISITVTPVNDNPVAANDKASTKKKTPVIINVLSNDSDVDGGTLTISAVTQGAKGGVVGINADGTISYAPLKNFNGTDTFTYTVSDGQGGTATATVTVTVK